MWMNVSGTTYPEGRQTPCLGAGHDHPFAFFDSMFIAILLLYGIRFSKLSFKVVGTLALRWKNMVVRSRVREVY